MPAAIKGERLYRLDQLLCSLHPVCLSSPFTQADLHGHPVFERKPGSLQTIGVIRRKYHFKTRPRAMISKPS